MKFKGRHYVEKAKKFERVLKKKQEEEARKRQHFDLKRRLYLKTHPPLRRLTSL